MKIEHTALYVRDLETSKAFFETYFGAVAGPLYHNVKTTFQSYFLTFEEGARLEIMTRDRLQELPDAEFYFGYAHLAFSVGSAEKVNQMAEKFVEDGYKLISGPRTTGDGYYEACILDAEGNQIEITI